MYKQYSTTKARPIQRTYTNLTASQSVEAVRRADLNDPEPSTGNEVLYTVFSNTEPGTTVNHVYLSKSIGAPEGYVDLIFNMHVADESDVFVFHLNSPGGQLDTGIQLLNAIRTTKATVVTILESEVASMATLLFLAGDQQVVMEDASLMFHDFRSVMIGTGTNMKYQLDSTISRVSKLAHDVCYPFFSHDEIDEILAGKDRWLNCEEIHERFQQAEERVKRDQAAAAAAARKASNATKKVVTKKAASKKVIPAASDTSLTESTSE